MTDRAIPRLFGAILMAVGGLIALLSGSCTLLVMGFGAFDNASAGELLSVLPLALLFGAPPFAVGAGLFIWGRSLFRGPKPPPVATDLF